MPRDTFGKDDSKESPDAYKDLNQKEDTSLSWDDQADEIARLVHLANCGNEHATMELLKKFSVYLERWEILLLYKQFDLNQLDIRSFICLYMRDLSIRKRLKAKLYHDDVISEAWKVVVEINYLVTSMLEKEDIQQLLSMVFLHCLRRYKPMEKNGVMIPFFRYFYYRFRLELKSELTKLTMDPVFSYGYSPVTTGNTKSVYGEDLYELVDETTVDEFIFDEDFDYMWIHGYHASFPFNILKPSERQILKWHYRDGLRRKDIANFLGCSRVLVTNTINVACEKLSSAMGGSAGDFNWQDWEE